jgi:hypothetical protein
MRVTASNPKEPFCLQVVKWPPSDTIGNVEKIMRVWLEHDPVALAVLVIGLAAVELLAFSI